MNIIQQIQHLVRSQGVQGAGEVIWRGLAGRPARVWPQLQETLKGMSGVEIGGPSGLFCRGKLLPVYETIKNLDGVNFSTRTMWEGALKDGGEFRFAEGKPVGRQWVREATDLHGIPDEGYDFLLNSHVIEHVANPLRALDEWKRVLKPGGWMVMVVPHRDGTFDRRRPITSIEHLIKDYQERTGEDDTTHFSEEGLIDHSLKPGDPRDLGVDLSIGNNFVHRMWHHHVFDSLLVAQMLDAAGMQIAGMEAARPFNVIAVARKAGEKQNAQWLKADADYLRTSPFKSDRLRAKA